MKGWPRATFFALGVVICASSMWLTMHWIDVARAVGLRVAYDTRPAWLRVLMTVIRWSPGIALGGLTALRIAGKKTLRPLAFAGGAAVVYVVLVGRVFLTPGIEEYSHRQQFNPAAWRRNERKDIEWPARLTMIDDLLARHSLRGLHRDSVERLLGPRDSTSHFSAWDLVYWLGPERGFMSIDSEWLVITFGTDGRAIDARVVRD